MKKYFILIAGCIIMFACNNEKDDDKNGDDDDNKTSMSSDKKNADELLDMSEGESAKNSLIAFSKGDIDGMTSLYDDNIRFLWSNGDSLVGKKAVQDYYKSRWNLIDSLTFSEHIVLPVKVNVQQSQFAPTGKWVLHWAMTHVKYKNGKKIDFWVHQVNHYNDAGKVDFVGQYLDRHPIMEATKDMVK